jgi:hypothetical protein
LQQFPSIFKQMMAEASGIYLNTNEHLRANTEVETRERYGDWEGDTIIDGVPPRANHQGAIATANRFNIS